MDNFIEFNDLNLDIRISTIRFELFHFYEKVLNDVTANTKMEGREKMESCVDLTESLKGQLNAVPIIGVLARRT